MNTLLQIAVGLVVLAVPLALAGGAVLILALGLSLVPIALPLTTTALVLAFVVAWLRWRKRDRSS